MNGLYVSADIFASEKTRSKLVENPMPNELSIFFAGDIRSLIPNELKTCLNIFTSGMHNTHPQIIARTDSE